MSVPSNISLLTVKAEIAACSDDAEVYGWVISEINKVTQRFSVTMKAKDSEVYKISFQFDNYPQLPFLIDFIDPDSGVNGTKHAYPKSGDSFFHPNGVICHPCSRKPYSGYSGLHCDWNITGWKLIADTLTTLHAILHAIYSRITNNNYAGRMAP
jgi:hypothetical protein